MKALIPLLILVLLSISCHKHEDEFIPVPPEPETSTPETPPQISEEENETPVYVDSNTFEYRIFKDLPYRLLRPRKFSPEQHYPLLVFLHGMGERGADNEKQLNTGASYFLLDSIRQKHAAFIVYPQCPLDAFWFDDEIMTLLKELLDSLQQEFPVMNDRISIAGFSMGAYGTFAMTSRYPGYFEAALAISGDGDEENSDRMAKSRWRIFAGELDEIVPSAKTRKIAHAIEIAGAPVEFILYPEADHEGTWSRAFAEPDFFDWLLSLPSLQTPAQVSGGS